MSLVYIPGESPFHVRGIAYLGIHDDVQARVPGGMRSVAGALPEGPHRNFALQEFDADEWYDALPLRPVTEVAAKLARLPWEDSVAERARAAARRDLTVLRRVFVRAAGLGKVVERLQEAALEYFDFGETETSESAEAGGTRLVFHGVPQPLGSWFLPMIRGYGAVLIETAGGREPKIAGRLIPKGRHGDGMQLVDVRIDLEWRR
ncbi:hypothetical protein G6O69_16785 [Pseudenhygromyxa sp. WMMC2535]|uniref:hypothetical protein n=1 Tax=Pseudenhygromyxa sp. WMMC2535 TaxID=2712867 RepID=UPI0015534D86|nr:hypothetical protein [Pseudenhygromyxa sp. WMMC2535]NVB39500.1 hypothetical protein [Pseudenhygromyxa sp. WMMC2535]